MLRGGKLATIKNVSNLSLSTKWYITGDLMTKKNDYDVGCKKLQKK